MLSANARSVHCSMRSCCTAPRVFAALLNVDLTKEGDVARDTLSTAARNVRRVWNLKDGLVRTFCNRTKHGSVLMRRVPGLADVGVTVTKG